jgi:hypothetical protein
VNFVWLGVRTDEWGLQDPLLTKTVIDKNSLVLKDILAKSIADEIRYQRESQNLFLFAFISFVNYF